jgi:type VI protein secretion system component VasF
MSNDWSIYIFVFVIAAILLARMDRLGKQLEAVSARIRADLARTEDDRSEVMSDWKQSQKDQAKDARLSWIFWGIVVVAALIWNTITKH